MLKTLPSDFAINKYGLHARLVCEDDAGFIIKLRTNPKVGNFIHKTDTDIDLQKEWIRRYKQREAVGQDYYFIHFYQGEPVGVNRLYDIDGENFNHGSWVFKSEVPSFCSIAAVIIAMEIAFYELDLKKEVMTDGVHIDNVGALNFSRMLGVTFDGKIEDEKGTYLTGYMTKEAFEKNVNKIKRFIPNK